MIVQIKEASIEQKPILERLMQLYLYDFSEIEGGDVNRDGLFEYKYLDSYWTESGRFPFLIYVDDKIAGFVLVNSHTYLQKRGEGKSIAEFFVMRKYRKQGIGKMVAFHIFDRFPGKWEVQQTKRNVVAQRFWRNVIGEYTGSKFAETILDSESWHGPIQSFDNSHKTQT
jgi:predicted acetyltransferase